MQERTDVASEGGSVTLPGVNEQVRPGWALKVSATPSAKPFNPVIVIVELPCEPTLIEEGDTVPALIVKSTTLKTM